MNKSKELVNIGIIICIFTFLFADDSEARGRRKKIEKSPEQKIQDCLSNTSGLAISLESALNTAVNSRAENVAKTDWQKYCSCIVPKSEAIENSYPRGNLPVPEFQKLQSQKALAMVDCGNISVPDGKPEVPTVPKMTPDARFEASLNNCKKRPKGHLTNLQVHLKVRKSPRADKVQSMDANKYCDCYVNSMRAKLGDDKAHKTLTTYPDNTPEETQLIDKAKNETFDYCAAEQIPFK